MKFAQRAFAISLLSVTPVLLSLPTYAADDLKATAEKSAATSEKSVIVVHLQHFTDDLHAASMAVKLATAMQSKGADVTLFLDLEGVRVADTRQPQDLSWGQGHGLTFANLYDDFVKAGGKVLVCPHCAQAVGLTEKELRPGVKIAKDANEVADLLLSASKILDY